MSSGALFPSSLNNVVSHLLISYNTAIKMTAACLTPAPNVFVVPDASILDDEACPQIPQTLYGFQLTLKYYDPDNLCA
jgi:hypothetical protein